jgi:hypothetical protein
VIRAPVVVCLAAVLAACATRPADDLTVHIFSNEPAHPRVQAVTDALDAAGYAHRITYAKTPGDLDVTETVIVHGDSAQAYNHARALAELLEDESGRPRIERAEYGNHYFSPGNLGLYLYRPGAPREPERAVHAHLAGDCGGRPVELFLYVDRSYRLTHQAWEGDYTLVEGGQEDGTWQPEGAGYRLDGPDEDHWTLEPPLDGDPALTVYFIAGHAPFDGCRLAAPL